MFFGTIAVLQQIPNIAPTSRYATIVPLTFVLTVSAVRELFEDWKRLRADKQMNNKLAEVLDSDGQRSSVRWMELRCGQVVKLVNGEAVPADMILLSTSLPEHMCYIETSSIDGETNLKIRQAKQDMPDLNSLNDAIIRCELPNEHIYRFEGTLETPDLKFPLGPEQFLHRGCFIRNTGWVIGIIIYAGSDTKLIRNMSTTPIKTTRLEGIVNRQIVAMFVLLLLMALTTSIMFMVGKIWIFEGHWYLYSESDAVALSVNPLDWLLKLATFILLYHNVIPISLYVTLELVRVRLAELINSDVEMYHEETDTPAAARTSSLVEELGQVEYILSDKTGTLTCNSMRLRHLVIQGQEHDDVIESFDSSLLDSTFVTSMAVCHSVITETVEGELVYQGSSPDEIALLNGLKQMGCRFVGRRPKEVRIEVLGAERVYELLALIEFTSTRKRMSVLVRDETSGDTRLITKGADTVILDRLKDRESATRTMELLEKFANSGLRTLCYAQRKLSREEAEAWLKEWQDAQNTVNYRQEALDSCSAEIETELELIGATAVEDRLQDGVPETIRSLRAAGIKIWVLTGDRTETAINIGYSAGLLDENSELLLCGQASQAALDSLAERASHTPKCSLVIDGFTLERVVAEGSLQDSFLRIASRCASLICCRVSPLQKAQITLMVKDNLKGTCLAIGDGANDVSMIQSAHVGVGISGNEGLQAARSADFAIAQFRFLGRLLLVHGSWSYHRISKVALYSTYKNITLVMCTFWFSWLTQWSGQTLFEPWMIGFYNMLFTALPPLVLGITDKYVDAKYLLRNPQLYRFGPRNKFFNTKIFWESAVTGMIQSAMIFAAIVVCFWGDPALPGGTTPGHWWIGCLTYFCVLITVTIKLILTANFWTFLMLLVVIFSILSWFCYLIGYDLVASYIFPSINFEIQRILLPLITSPAFWFASFLLPIFATARDLGWKFYKRQYRPREYHIIQEIQLEEKKVGKSIQLQPKQRKIRVGKRAIRGFSFSQTEGGQTQALRSSIKSSSSSTTS